MDRGHIGDVRLDGLVFVVVNRGLGENADGNWYYIYLSENATDAQAGALKAMFEEQMKAFGDRAKAMFGKNVGMRKVPITYTLSADQREYAVVIPGILEFRGKALVLPGHTEPVRTTGIFDDYGDSFTHVTVSVHTYADKSSGYSFDLSGRQANFAPFSLTASRAEKGGIGWVCYGAVTDKSKYEEQDAKDGHK